MVVLSFESEFPDILEKKDYSEWLSNAPPARNEGKKWTKTELKLVEQCFNEDMSIIEIAIVMGRSIDSIKNVKTQLGLRKSKKERYIHLDQRMGQYIITKTISKQHNFGSFNSLEEAKHERDILEKCNWDWDAYVNYDFEEKEDGDKENPYKNAENEESYGSYASKPIKIGYDDDMRYIRLVQNRSCQLVWQIWRDNQSYGFFHYSKIDDCKTKRNVLEAYGWDRK